jgi:hypothetical protein
MAPHLTDWQHELIRGMIQGGKRTPEIVKAANCSERSVMNIRSNLRYFGTTRAPANRGGRPPSITAPMLEALCSQLLDRPELYVPINPTDFPIQMKRVHIPLGSIFDCTMESICRIRFVDGQLNTATFCVLLQRR